MATILARAGGHADYVKMDIEGVEQHLLTGPAADWLNQIDSISLQTHDPYTNADCIRDLDAAGFDAREDVRRKNYVVAVRRRSPGGRGR
jgi:hypothetical protein